MHSTAADPPTGPWTFDPVRLGAHECDAWVGYYRRDWLLVLRSAVGMVKVGFGMGRLATLLGAWWVLRANRVWAPYPDNDPDRAREYMRRFYAMVVRSRGLAIDPAEAARREVLWWREHRVLQPNAPMPTRRLWSRRSQTCMPTCTDVRCRTCSNRHGTGPWQCACRTCGWPTAAASKTRAWLRNGGCWCVPTPGCSMSSASTALGERVGANVRPSGRVPLTRVRTATRRDSSGMSWIRCRQRRRTPSSRITLGCRRASTSSRGSSGKTTRSAGAPSLIPGSPR